MAQSGSLGKAVKQDIRDQPTVTLKETMALAADRDMIARQYVTDFADVYLGCDYFRTLRQNPSEAAFFQDCPMTVALRYNDTPPSKDFILPGDLESDIIRLHLWFLSRYPDSLLVRKRGSAEGRELQQLAQLVLDEPTRLPELESWFDVDFPHRNPGTT